MKDNKSILEVRNLSFSYGVVPVLEDISFCIGAGEVIAVLGANGAGKSTLFRCILGLLRHYRGDVFLEGGDVLSMSRKEIAANAAYVPQAESPVFNYSVTDTVLMGTTGSLSLLENPGQEQVKAVEQALDSLGISHLSERGIQEISGGERQLAFLARALVQKSRLLIMDEPTANLDYGNQQLVLRHVRKLAQEGYSVLLSTHNPEHALQYASKVLIIKDHHLYAYGDTSEILTEKTIGEIYGLKVMIITADVDGMPVRSCIPLA